jgi:N-acetylglucosaminyldiphosphoundecaprenol N-acetyl-beta-D-mannosaminyltransferase
MQETIKAAKRYINEGMPLHLMGVNADKINMLNRNERLKRIVNNCDIINADGASVVLASKYMNSPLPERVAGIDLMLELVEVAEKNDYSVFLLGAKQEIVKKTAEILNRQHPKLIIAGIHDGYFEEKEWNDIADILIESNPNIVFVGVTSPMKEYLIEFLQNKGLKCVFMGVGGSFDVISGMIPRAPLWMQKINLEWLFRVIKEPRRLYKRYLIGNWEFIRAVILEKKALKKKGIEIMRS